MNALQAMAELADRIVVLNAEANKLTEDWGDAQKRIAELEAKYSDVVAEHENELALRLEAEAELAALKGRRCERCHWLGEVDSRNWKHCKKLGDWEPPDFSCNRWAERGT